MRLHIQETTQNFFPGSDTMLDSIFFVDPEVTAMARTKMQVSRYPTWTKTVARTK